MNRLNFITLAIICIFPFGKCGAQIEENIIHNNSIKNKQIVLILGKWFIPHSASINITFYEDATFIFNDFNFETLKEEVLSGTFELNYDELILKYTDRPQQTFKFEKGKGADDNYYIKKGKNYYFVKSDVEDW